MEPTIVWRCLSDFTLTSLSFHDGLILMTFDFDDTYDFAVLFLPILNRRLHHQFLYAVKKNFMTHATMIYTEYFLNRKIDDIFHHNFTQLWQFMMIWDKCIILKYLELKQIVNSVHIDWTFIMKFMILGWVFPFVGLTIWSCLILYSTWS